MAAAETSTSTASKPAAGLRRAPPWLAPAGTLAAFFAGAALGLIFLVSVFPVASVPIAAGLSTALYAARGCARSRGFARRALGVLGWTGTALAYALWVYLAVAWGSVLAWTVPAWGWGLLGIAALAALLTARPGRTGARVPAALPLGLWIALCLLGWRVEERLARCDDYLAVRDGGAAEILSPTTGELEGCERGAELPIGRFPRVVWEAPGGDRLVVTTSEGRGASAPLPGARFTGSVCEIRRGEAPRCIGEGKAQGLAESAALDRVFIASWGRIAPDVRGRLIAIPRSGPLEVLAEVRTEGSFAELFYDGAADRVFGFTDEGFEVIPVVASTMRREPAVAAPLFPPGAVRYDQARGEGILCASSGPVVRLDGARFMSVAMRGDPLALRGLGAGPLALATMTWGCDFDPVARRAWVAIPNLGLLATLDYDSGAVLRTDFVGFGVRSVTHDAARGRLYLTNFLAGHVSAVDPATGDEEARWAVGRFPRTAAVSRDGASLLVGTSLGVVAIRLR